ncbi:hypothetical protein NDU88_001686 [Pleurodeles waltl]|uniref:Uncharacterized protein n=1 Tax=Pleurodeles waltl TaxID=8319 RepID=A0AAV7V8H6_PLEWA|nr:hypothetical protein NDU88_001686 [Pleurodeles waltl]
MTGGHVRRAAGARMSSLSTGSRSWPSARYLLKREHNNCRLRKNRVPSQRAPGRRAQSRKRPKLPCASREALRIMRQPAVYETS